MHRAGSALVFCAPSRCVLSLKGETFARFPLEAGVRQGCPLSPLVYALVAEALLDKLEQDIDGILVRAYADDTVLILKQFLRVLPPLERFFVEFAAIFGLRLNLRKPVVVPLTRALLEQNAASFMERATAWKDMSVQHSAKTWATSWGLAMAARRGTNHWLSSTSGCTCGETRHSGCSGRLGLTILSCGRRCSTWRSWSGPTLTCRKKCKDVL
ncbi:unnamed protein product [Prorocentrum cordatum]|uniref:Reverse transcriptase domain-containing protein n=1 Tax=Prorocentrum cordatum TaxID=2364126 RepID=A0ABN9S3G6_9DINO|nr:unnamed protein product [Polarella glacialis]